jgi:hypothetical protein
MGFRNNGYGYYGKGKGGYAGDDDFHATSAAPSSAPTTPGPTAAPSSDSNPGCIQVAFQEEFLFLSADLAIPPTTTDPNEIGTSFIYAPSPLFNATEFTQSGASVEIPGSQVTGACTRTLEPLDGVGGGGVCQFTIDEGDSATTFSGFVRDYVAGNAPPTLVITGGSGFNTGITGEVALLPLDGNGDPFTGDIFFDAFGYQATASAMILVCEVVGAV